MLLATLFLHREDLNLAETIFHLQSSLSGVYSVNRCSLTCRTLNTNVQNAFNLQTEFRFQNCGFIREFVLTAIDLLYS